MDARCTEFGEKIQCGTLNLDTSLKTNSGKNARAHKWFYTSVSRIQCEKYVFVLFPEHVEKLSTITNMLTIFHEFFS